MTNTKDSRQTLGLDRSRCGVQAGKQSMRYKSTDINTQLDAY